MATGELVSAIAMSEPGAGSDLQGIKTSAVRDGDDYVINGSKIFITNGYLSDLVIVVAKTDPAAGAKGTSLLLVEAGMAGFSKGRKLKKVGMKAQDTAELFFDNVRVPAENLLGEEGMGFIYLMQELPQERLSVAVNAIAATESALRLTVDYVKERKAFGKPVSAFQNTQFKLAEMDSEVTAMRVFIDRCIELHLQGKLDIPTAAKTKLLSTDLQCKVIDECVQLHGGYGYMWEYPIARAWADSRVQRIYAGTNEVMKVIISRALLGYAAPEAVSVAGHARDSCPELRTTSLRPPAPSPAAGSPACPRRGSGTPRRRAAGKARLFQPPPPGRGA
jgi:acyl-CoA dehydrogenase